MPNWRWLLLNLTRRLWVRATLIGILGVAAAVAAALADRLLPWELGMDIGAGSVDSILSILASSMLTVSTFSLSVMTSAFGSATSNVTPRATRLLVEDRITQNVLSTFIGSFLFSIVGIVALQAGAYDEKGRAVLFIVTILVIAMIIVSLMRWIDHLTRLGRVGETTDRVEAATRAALVARLDNPWLGGSPGGTDAPAGGLEVRSGETGYVVHLDMARLASVAGAVGGRVVMLASPGSFVYRETVLMRLVPGDDDGDDGDDGGKERDAPDRARLDKALSGDAEAARELADTARIGVTVADKRTYDQDPRFGFSVLSEVAQRALSPAVNDPGTAIDVIGRAARLLELWAAGPAGSDTPGARRARAEGRGETSGEPPYPAVCVPGVATEDLFDDVFRLLARDGAALFEVQMRLRKTLRALSEAGDPAFRAAARHQAALALKRAEGAMTLEDDLERLRKVRIG